MTNDESNASEALSLNPQEFELALKMLASEEHRGQDNVLRLIFNLIFMFSFGVGLLACPLGYLIKLVDPPVGQWLVVMGWGAAVVFVILSIFHKGNFLLTSKDIREAFGVGSSSFDKIATEAWEKRQESINCLAALILILGVLSILVGISWLAYSLFARHTASVMSVILIFWPVIAFFLLTGIKSYQEYQYFSQAARLRAKLLARQHEQLTEIPLTADEHDQLVQVQSRYIEANVKQAVKQFAESAAELYSICYQPEALEFLRRQSAVAQASIQDRVDALQSDPYPSEARPATEGFFVRSNGYFLLYNVDDERRRVTVTGIDNRRDAEADHAA